MNLLVLGGTSYVGRTLVQEAVRRGHQVTTFNRGRTGPDEPGVTAIRGDRSSDEDVKALTGRPFDAVLDPGGLVPAQVLRTARTLAGAVPFYAYVSSTAVYRDWSSLPWREDSPTHQGTPHEDGDPADIHRLGPRKAGCEQAVLDTFGTAAALILRPGLIAGPYDNVGMLPWWILRARRGGRMLAPGSPDRPLQLIDVRDLVVFLLDQVQTGRAGLFNTVPSEPAETMATCLAACVAATGAGAEPVWVDEAFLLAHGAQPWSELPFWLPSTPEPAVSWPASGAAARTAGLTCRPLADTVHATWDWLRGGGAVRRPAVIPAPGLDPEKEQRILSAWTSERSG